MKQLILAFLLLAVASSSQAFDTAARPPRRGDRIGIIRMADRPFYGAEGAIINNLQKYLRDELRERGFDAVDAGATFDQLARNAEGGDDKGRLDYYVEIVSGDAHGGSFGSVGVNAGAVSADLSVLRANVAAEVRLYDGRNLNLIDRYDLHGKSTALLPTGVGVGGYRAFGFIAVPFVRYAQYRSVAHDVAREAASRIAGEQSGTTANLEAHPE